MIATATDPAALIAHFVELPWVLEVAAHGDTKATVVTKQGLRLDLRVVPPEDYGSLLQHFTGSKDHNVALREEAQRRGLSVSEYGVTVVETGEVHRFGAEEELYRFLGYAFIPPELRENGGELQAARDGGLPALVETGDLVGELHCHSTWSSDGKGSIEEMAPRGEAARLSLPRADRPLALPPRGADGGAVGGDRGGERSASSRSRCCAGSRRTSARTARSTSPTTCSRELDWVVASLHAAFDRARPSGSSPRSTIRTSTASGT